MTTDKDFEVLLAERAIRQALLNYCRSIDRLDPDLLASVLHPDATIDYEGYFRGTGDEMVEFFMEAHRRYATHSHQVTGSTIAVDGDRAVSETYVFARIRSYPDETGRCVDVNAMGRYLDRWSRRDGVWAIDDRRYLNDVISEYEVVNDYGPLPDRPDDATLGLARRDRDDPAYALFESLK